MISFVGVGAMFSILFILTNVLFLWAAQYIPPKPGPIVDLITGKTIGKHRGLFEYTIGQNAGIAGMPQKMFVAKKDSKENTVYVVPGG